MRQKYEECIKEKSQIKLENAELSAEIKECVKMFKSTDKFRISKLNEHIGFLKTENCRLAEKLKQTHLDMNNLAKTERMDWLHTMLEYCESVSIFSI